MAERELAEAAALRQQAADLEAELEERRREARREVFNRVKAPGAHGCGIQQLQAALEELTGQEVATRQAELVLHKLGGGRDQLTLQDFQRRAFLEDACRVVAADRVEAAAAERAAREEEVARRAEERHAARRAKIVASLPPPNEDASLFVRVCAVLPYVLPLIDTIRLLGPAMVFAYAPDQYITLFPPHPPLEGMLPFLETMQPLLVFAMPMMANRRRIPHLLRFNLNQAFVLELILVAARTVAMGAAFLFSLTSAHDELLMPVSMEVPELLPGTEVIVFFMALCVTYSVGHTAWGLVPDAIPYISTEADASLASGRKK